MFDKSVEKAVVVEASSEGEKYGESCTNALCWPGTTNRRVTSNVLSHTAHEREPTI